MSPETCNIVMYREVLAKRQRLERESIPAMPWWIRYRWEEIVLLATCELALLAWVAGLI